MKTFQQHFCEEIEDLKATITDINKTRSNFDNLHLNTARHADQELASRVRCHFYELVLRDNWSTKAIPEGEGKELLREFLKKQLQRPIKKVGVYSAADILYDVCLHNAAREMLDKLDQYPWGE